MDKKFNKKTASKKRGPSRDGETVERKGMTKKYLKVRQSCRVTFSLPKEAIKKGKKVTLVGDFNGWDPESTPLKKLRNGSFAVTVELLPGRTYRFKYLIDQSRWENDWYADMYISNPYGGEDSAVAV